MFFEKDTLHRRLLKIIINQQNYYNNKNHFFFFFLIEIFHMNHASNYKHVPHISIKKEKKTKFTKCGTRQRDFIFHQLRVLLVEVAVVR